MKLVRPAEAHRPRAVRKRHFGDHDAPSTLLGVATLGYPGQLVEVEAVAAVGE